MKKTTYANILGIIFLIVLIGIHTAFGLSGTVITGFALVFYAIAILRWEMYELQKRQK